MKQQTKQTLKIFFGHARKYKRAVFILTTGIIASNILEVYRPFIYKKFIDQLSIGNKNFSGSLISLVVGLLLVDLGSWFFMRSALYVNNYFQPRAMADLMNTSFNKLHQHSINFFNNNFSGSLVRRVSRYYRSFEDIADIVFWDLGQTVLKLLLILGVLFVKYWQIGLLVLGWSLLYVYFNFRFSEYKLKYDSKRAEIDSSISGRISDTVVNNTNIKVFNGFDYEKKSFKSLTQDWRKIYQFSWNLSLFSDSFQGLLTIFLEFLVLIVAVRFWQQGRITVGDIVLFEAYLLDLFGQLRNVGRHIRRAYEALADAEEMTDILTQPLEVADIQNAQELVVHNGSIAFKDVKFKYIADRPIFENFNLDIKAGQKVALIGPSGGGKTTIVKLLLRFFDVNSGTITIDGVNIAGVTQESLRKQIAFVPQEPILFHRSLLENIQYANPNATEEQVIAAAQLAHCHEFISQLPDGYATLVGERGVKLSGGERQRVAIARAILKNAPILILDEATSSLDSESEALIQDALRNLMKSSTTIAIAHRLSTIMQMDRIIVIEKGTVIEEGKHEELLKIQKGTYQKLWNIQVGGFEGG